MQTKKQPYKNNISTYFIWIVILAFIIGFSSCESNHCPDCGEAKCIYQDINQAVKGEGTDSEIEAAIQQVCKDRNITDEKTIDLLRANYYL